MDCLSALLDGPRAQGAFVLRSSMDPPWSLWVQDEAPLTIVAVVRGTAWIVPEGQEPSGLGAGDLAILSGPSPYLVADRVDTAPQMVIYPGQRCATPDGRDLGPMTDQGTRSWGNTSAGESELLTGTYQTPTAVGRRLLGGLPPLAVVRAAEWDSPLVDFLAAEVGKDAPGQESVLDRLLDLLLIGALRAWFSGPHASAPSWYTAHADPVVGTVLHLMHDDPAAPWTIERLARRSGTSRASLARRFRDLVGEPPMTYLAGWRLTLAADLLREPDTTITEVARKVGYGTPFALSAAFKRVYGISPRDHRQHAS